MTDENKHWEKCNNCGEMHLQDDKPLILPGEIEAKICPNMLENTWEFIPENKLKSDLDFPEDSPIFED